VDLDEVVEHDARSQRSHVILWPLAESIAETRVALHVHPHRDVLTFRLGRTDVVARSFDALPLLFVIACDYDRSMTGSELKRKLKDAGCTFEKKTKHELIVYKGKATVMPRHPAKEIASGTLKAILKQLGIEKL
jgi:mRNA interferase HicA